jgi:general stress protein 26
MYSCRRKIEIGFFNNRENQMNKTFDDAIKLLEETSTALLITFVGENRLDSRLIGPYVNEGLNVYLFTSINSNKINQIEKDPCVSLYLQNKFENTRDYKSLLINGKAAIITDETEINSVKAKLEMKSKGYKKWIDKDGWQKWAVVKVQTGFIKYTDNGTSPVPQCLDIKK